jgi:hypothetical protein
MHMPLTGLKDWGPFKLDALGLVTLLGADEVARAVGTLSPNSLTDFMPLLGGYRIAGNQFIAVETGYTMYNLSDGITNTEFSAWFTRWLSQHVGENAAVDLELVRERRPGVNHLKILSVVLGTLAHMSMLIFAAAQGDWWGVANASALFVATCVRNYLIQANRDLYDKKIAKEIVPNSSEETTQGAATRGLELKRPEKKKILIVRPDGTLVVMRIPLSMLLTLFGKLNPTSTSFFSKGWHGMYTVARGIGWLAFGIHIITIGQAYLTSQILAVGIMAIATILTIFNIGTQKRPRHLKWSRRSRNDRCDGESANPNSDREPSTVLHYDLGRWLTISVLTLEGKPPPSAVSRNRDGTAQGVRVPTQVAQPLSISTKPTKQPEPQREVNRREWYAFLTPTKQQQTWMREWHLIALEPNTSWYAGWYNFLRGWKAERESKSAGNAWDQIFGFLGIPGDEKGDALNSIWLGPETDEANIVSTANSAPTPVSRSAQNQPTVAAIQIPVQAVADAGGGTSST